MQITTAKSTIQICKMNRVDGENEVSKNVDQFIKKEEKIWDKKYFYCNSSDDVCHSSPGTSVCYKSEFEFVPLEDEFNMGQVQTSVKKETKDGIIQFVDEPMDNIGNRKDIRCLEDYIDFDHSSHITPVCHVKSEYESIATADDSDMEEERNSVEEETKDEALQFIEEKTRKIWNRADTSDLENCIKKETHHNALSEDVESLPKIQFPNRPEKRCTVGETGVPLQAKPHVCHMCGYSSTRKFHLRTHIDSVHLRAKPHKCHLCDYTTTRKSHLKTHIDGVHQQVKSQKCDLCDYSSTLKSYLKKHIDSVHLKIKSHKCDFCDYRATLNSNLRRHVDSVHLQAKPHKCNFCDYSAARKGHLKIHTDSVHRQTKPFKCDICDFSSARKGNLKVHIDSIHRQAKPHKCDLCDYSAARKGNLKVHIDSAHHKNP